MAGLKYQTNRSAGNAASESLKGEAPSLQQRRTTEVAQPIKFAELLRGSPPLFVVHEIAKTQRIYSKPAHTVATQPFLGS